MNFWDMYVSYREGLGEYSLQHLEDKMLAQK